MHQLHKECHTSVAEKFEKNLDREEKKLKADKKSNGIMQ